MRLKQNTSNDEKDESPDYERNQAIFFDDFYFDSSKYKRKENMKFLYTRNKNI